MFWSDALTIPKQDVCTHEIDQRTPVMVGDVNTIYTKIIVLKLWVRIQQCTAVHFQSWSKMTLKIKMAYFSIFRSGF